MKKFNQDQYRRKIAKLSPKELREALVREAELRHQTSMLLSVMTVVVQETMMKTYGWQGLLKMAAKPVHLKPKKRRS